MRRPDLTVATMDHDVPTIGLDKPIADPLAAAQIARLRQNCAAHGITLHALGSIEQGIVHVIGPQLGLTQPGMTVVCGDSHTSTHGAFGALAFGIGTTEVEHVLATQTLRQVKPAAMAVTVEGELADRAAPPRTSCSASSGRSARGGGVGSVIEYRGDAIRALSMEGRMTVCNMSIEGGARAGMIAPGRHHVRLPGGPQAQPAGQGLGARPSTTGARLVTDDGAEFDHEIRIDAAALRPAVTWGTTPGAVGIDRRRGARPGLARARRPRGRRPSGRSTYMDLKPGTAIRDIAVDAVFIGSCTNGRLEDLRAAADVVRGRKVHPGVRALVVPGSARVKARGRGRGPGQAVHRGRLRVAVGRLLDVPGHERRHPGARRALGLDQQQQLRGPPGPRRPHPPGVARRRGGNRRGRALHACQGPVREQGLL